MTTLNNKDFKRYWAKVIVRGLDECWEYKGALNWKGYGFFSTFKNGRKSGMNGHRVGLISRLGPLPKGIDALHSCIGHPWCQNPIHVYPGTNLENIADKVRQGRQRGARGERCKAHKLVTAEILEIRSLYRTGQYLQKDLAKSYGVTQQQISRIVRRKRWEHLA